MANSRFNGEAVNKLEHASLVSFVVRTVGRRQREIRRAIASIAANTWRPLEVVVVYQGAQSEQWLNLKNLVDEFPSLKVRVITNSAIGDRRAQNLNIGWEQAEGRYIGFLDDDDTLEANHVELLVGSMQTTEKSWAYAQVTLRKENQDLEMVSESRPFRRNEFSLKALWAENFLPIHSFLIDRSKLNETLRQSPFLEDLDRSEDWDFLLRLAFYHEPAVVEEFTATYHVSTLGHNTNLSLMENSGTNERERKNKEAWARCKAIVEARKMSLITSVWWANACFDLVLSNSNAEKQQAIAANKIHRSLRQRVIRRCIRILERML